MLSLECTNCGKKYRAPDHLAGHKVKCRGCGTVFALVEPSNGDIDLAGAAAMETSRSSSSAASTMGGRSPVATSASPRTAPMAGGDVRSAPAETLDAADAVFQGAFSSGAAITPGRPARRANVPIPYPGSREIDRWMPIALPAISLLWVGIEVFVSNGSGAIWAPFVRLLLLLAGFFLIVLPIGWLSANIAAAQGRFHLPPNPKLRTIAAFSLPMAIAAFLYLSLGSLSSAIPGAFLGIAIAMGALWLLLRVKPEESVITILAGGAAFAIAIMICAGLLVALNSGVRNLAGGSGSQLAESPLGPGLPWQKAEKKDPHKKHHEDAPGAPTPDAIAQATPTTAAATQQIASSGTSDDPFAPSATPPAAEPVKPPAPAAPIVTAPPVASAGNQPPKKEENAFQGLIFGPATPKPAKAMPQEEDPDPTVLPPAPASTPPPGPAQVPTDYAAAGGDPIAFALAATKSPAVATVRKTAAIGTFDQLIAPLTPSNVVMVLKSGDRADMDLLETWDLALPKKLWSATIKRDVTTPIANPSGVPSYACSADGTLWARITTFPSLSLEVTPFAGGTPPVRVALKDPAGDVSVLGFATNDRLLIRWRLGEEERVEVWDIKTRSRLTQMAIPTHPSNGANGVLSPDGKTYAVIGSTSVHNVARTQLSLFETGSQPAPKVAIINGIDPQRALHPTGMAFSPDGKRLGVLYEQGGNTILLSYRLPALTPLEPMAAPAGRVTPGVDESVGGRLTSVAGGHAWLLGGNAILDAENGKLLGELGLDQVCMHPPLTTAAGEIMIVAGDAGQRRVTLVGLKSSTGPATRPK